MQSRLEDNITECCSRSCGLLACSLWLFCIPDSHCVACWIAARVSIICLTQHSPAAYRVSCPDVVHTALHKRLLYCWTSCNMSSIYLHDTVQSGCDLAVSLASYSFCCSLSSLFCSLALLVVGDVPLIRRNLLNSWRFWVWQDRHQSSLVKVLQQ